MESNSSSKTKYILLGLLALLIIVGGGVYYLGVIKQQPAVQKNNNIITATAIPTQTPTSTITPNPTTDWQMHSGANFLIQFPKDWVGKAGYNFSGDFMMYDPTSMQTKRGNGNGTITFPAKFVDVMSVKVSSETPSEYATRMTASNPAQSANSKAQAVSLGNLAGVIYQESGAGSIGYDLVVSNGKKLAVLNITTPTTNSDVTVSQILSSFTFTQ
jgi:hypothetical protein